MVELSKYDVEVLNKLAKEWDLDHAEPESLARAAIVYSRQSTEQRCLKKINKLNRIERILKEEKENALADWASVDSNLHRISEKVAYELMIKIEKRLQAGEKKA
jgi:hypothetical protein